MMRASCACPSTGGRQESRWKYMGKTSNYLGQKVYYVFFCKRCCVMVKKDMDEVKEVNN